MGVIEAHPILTIILISVILTLISTLITKWLTDQEHLKELKERQKELQKELKNCKDVNLMKEIEAEILKITGMMMKSSFKPMLITIIPFLILFYWLKNVYNPLVGFWGWFGYYLAASIVSGMIFRKVFKLA